jgi:hypothetical protein
MCAGCWQPSLQTEAREKGGKASQWTREDASGTREGATRNAQRVWSWLPVAAAAIPCFSALLRGFEFTRLTWDVRQMTVKPTDLGTGQKRHRSKGASALPRTQTHRASSSDRRKHAAGTALRRPQVISAWRHRAVPAFRRLTRSLLLCMLSAAAHTKATPARHEHTCLCVWRLCLCRW